MRKLGLATIALGASLALGTRVDAQGTFGLSVPVTSPDFPNIGTEGIIEGDVGQMFEITGNITVTSAGLAGPEGPQGWSLGISNAGVELLDFTVAGTVSATAANGGLVDGGFVENQIIDPNKKGNNGRNGVVQAVILSFTQPIFLPPNSAQITLKNRYRATIADAEAMASLKFEDGLVGKGQPVANNITFQGQTAVPTLGETKLTIRKKIVAGPEAGNCNDTVDNDLDGKIDCADEDCADDPVFCPVPENSDALCDDDKDNDKDGQTDCNDTDCKALAICQGPPTTGFDMILSTTGSVRDGSKHVAEIDCASGTSVDATASIAVTRDPEPKGAQGWSISVEHNPAILDIQNGDGFPAFEGTDGAANFSGGFQKTEVVDPGKNGGRAGLVSAVVLSFVEDRTLDATKNQSILRSRYTVKAGVAETQFPTQIRFENGLRGSGQPVENIITVSGNSVTPSAQQRIALELECSSGPPPSGRFIRGNANDDAKVNIADPIWIINELVRQGPKTQCQDAGDANDDGLMDLSDAMYLIQWRFLGGPQPSAPFTACGADPTADTLNCPEGSAASCP